MRVERDGLFEPADGDVVTLYLRERLAGEKEVPRVSRIQSRRFGREVERGLILSRLDQQLGEVGIDDVVVSDGFFVDEGDGLAR